MTIEQIIEAILALDSSVLTAAQASPLVGLSPNLIRWQAQHYPEKLGFPVVVAKSRVLIPKIPLLRFYGYWPEESDA